MLLLRLLNLILMLLLDLLILFLVRFFDFCFLLSQRNQFLHKGVLVLGFFLTALIEKSEKFLKCLVALRAFNRVIKVPLEHFGARFGFVRGNDARQLIKQLVDRL